MKTTALIIAAGVGERTGSCIPKQFITVYEKPIVIYTLEKFQMCKSVDDIAVVCLEGWENTLNAYVRQYGISKLTKVFPGGNSAQESIFNGLSGLKNTLGKDDIVIIHDGIRPMVDEEIIDSCIQVCAEHGNGVTALPVYEQVFRAKTEMTTDEYIPREKLRILQTPQAYHMGEILDAYERSFAENIGIHGSAYANTIMTDLGNELFFSKGSTKNIKITTKEDIEIFKAMLASS